MKTIIKKIDKISFIVIVDGVEYLPKDEDDIKTLSQYNYLNNVYMLHPSWYEDIMEGIEINSSKIVIKDEYAYVASLEQVEVNHLEKPIYKDIAKLEKELEDEATLITEAIHDVMIIANMNSTEVAFELIKTQFLVINRQDLKPE